MAFFFNLDLVLLKSPTLHHEVWKAWQEEYTFMNDEAAQWSQLKIAEVIYQILHPSSQAKHPTSL